MHFIVTVIAGLVILIYLRKRKQVKQTSAQEENQTAWLREYKKEQKTQHKQLKRNLRGIELEKMGKINEAIKLYEQNISENFEGNHPYDRLATIYRKHRQIDDEIRVLKKAIWVFEHVVHSERGDRSPKLDRFKKRLQKAQKLKLRI